MKHSHHGHCYYILIVQCIDRAVTGLLVVKRKPKEIIGRKVNWLFTSSNVERFCGEVGKEDDSIKMLSD